jgi:hypothetical protein
LLIRITHRDAKCQRWRFIERTQWLEHCCVFIYILHHNTKGLMYICLCPVHIQLTVISLGDLIPSHNVGGCVHIFHSLYSLFCDIYILSQSSAVLSTLPILILDNEQFWGKFKDICQKNISFIVFPLLRISLRKFRFSTLFFHVSGTNDYECFTVTTVPGTWQKVQNI